MNQNVMYHEIRKYVERRRTRPDEALLDDAISYVAQAKNSPDSTSYPDPIDYLKKIMEERHLRNRDLKIFMGSSGTVCSVLKRRKPLSLNMIRNLNKYLGIPAEILIQPYDCG
jgi:HTH-type transcriptional regulator/antitoxin HigA